MHVDILVSCIYYNTNNLRVYYIYYKSNYVLFQFLFFEFTSNQIYNCKNKIKYTR